MKAFGGVRGKLRKFGGGENPFRDSEDILTLVCS